MTTTKLIQSLGCGRFFLFSVVLGGLVLYDTLELGMYFESFIVQVQPANQSGQNMCTTGESGRDICVGCTIVFS